MNISGWIQLQFDSQMFQIFMFESVLKISECIEICNTLWKHIEKECWKL